MGGSAANTSFMVQSNESDFNSKKHANYFQQSVSPINPAPYTDKVTISRKMSAKAPPSNYQLAGKLPSPSKQQRRNTNVPARQKTEDQSCTIF